MSALAYKLWDYRRGYVEFNILVVDSKEEAVADWLLAERTLVAGNNPCSPCQESKVPAGAASDEDFMVGVLRPHAARFAQAVRPVMAHRRGHVWTQVRVSVSGVDDDIYRELHYVIK